MLPKKRFAKLARVVAVVFTPAVLLAALAGCRQPVSITFLETPPSSSGGSGRTALIRGHVEGYNRGRHIVLYAFADDQWWVQPLASAPITEISNDGSWKANVHLGTKYAAILTKDDSLPPPNLKSLPAIGKTIDAVAIVQATGTDTLAPNDLAPEKALRFSGYDWRVRTIPGDYAARTNEYNPENVFQDKSGALHMRLTENNGGWVCSELHSVRSLGYGDYRVELEDVGHLEPAVMFSIFTLVARPTDGDHRGMDIHITQRGEPSNKNAEFVVQPSFVPANFYYLNVPSGKLALQLKWSPDRAEFSASRAQAPEGQVIESWVFSTGVPKPDDAQIYINLCAYGNARIPPTHDAEVVVKSFEFFP